MKNKKGFTLVELMAVIVVLAIIIAIALPAYNRIKLNIDKKNYENKVDLIEVAASKYSEDTKYETMYVDDLIRNGYLDADDEKGYIYDPRDAKKIMNCYLVQSVEEAGIYYSKVIEKEYGTPGQCEANIPNSMNTGLKIKMYKDTGEEIKGDTQSKWWVNTDVQLKAEVNLKEGQSVETYEWYRGYDQTPISTSGSEITVTSTSVLQQNYTLRVTLNDGKIMTTIVRVYIDKIEPKFYDKDTTKDKTINNKWIKDLKYGIKAYDNESGLYGYKIYNSPDELPNDKNGKKDCSSDFKEYDKKNKNKEIKVNGEYPVCIIDNAGNVHRDNLVLDHIDNTDMSCHFEIAGTKGYIVGGNQWYIKDDLTLILKADKVGPSGVSLGMTTNNKEYYERTNIMDINSAKVEKIFNSNQNGVKYYGYIKNQASTKNTCEETIYFEKSITAPTLTKATSTYDTITAEYTSGSAISGIASTKCYVGTTSNPTTEVETEGNNCIFNVPATSSNTTYYFKKCITSKAGNTVCSTVLSKKNVGYCTVGNYKTTTYYAETESWGICSKPCDGGTQYKDAIRTDIYTSQYNNLPCGSNEARVTNYYSQDCNTQACWTSITEKVTDTGCSYYCTDTYSNTYRIARCPVSGNGCTGTSLSKQIDLSGKNQIHINYSIKSSNSNGNSICRIGFAVVTNNAGSDNDYRSEQGIAHLLQEVSSNGTESTRTTWKTDDFIKDIPLSYRNKNTYLKVICYNTNGSLDEGASNVIFKFNKVEVS